ncbi:MAG: DUF4097 family beta strand repeat-containing protein [Chloroflexota bacterium]
MTEQKNRKPYRTFADSPLFWAVMLAITFGLLAWGRLTNVREYAFAVDAPDTVVPVTIDLNLGEGNTFINSLPEGDPDLFDADITTPGLVEFDSDIDEDSVTIEVDYTPLSPLVGLLFGHADNQRNWDVRLAREVPTTLLINSGLGRTEADLRDMDLTLLRLETGLASVDARLPGGTYTAEVITGAGDVTLDVDDGATLAMSLNTAPGDVTLEAGDGISGTLAINAGVGAIEITLPEGTAVRLEVDEGLGDVNVPDWLVYGSDGAFETANYADADAALVITLNGGPGDFTLR